MFLCSSAWGGERSIVLKDEEISDRVLVLEGFTAPTYRSETSVINREYFLCWVGYSSV